MAEQGRILSTSLYKAAASGIRTVLSRLPGDVRAIVYDHLEFEDLLDVTMVSQGLRDTRGDVSHIHCVRLHKFHDAGVFQRLARCKYVHAIGRFPDDLALLETPLSAMNGVLTVVCSLLSRDPQYGVPNSSGWGGGCRALAETRVLRALERLEFFQIVGVVVGAPLSAPTLAVWCLAFLNAKPAWREGGDPMTEKDRKKELRH